MELKKEMFHYGTLSSIDESIFKFGKIVTGSDDGSSSAIK